MGTFARRSWQCKSQEKLTDWYVLNMTCNDRPAIKKALLKEKKSICKEGLIKAILKGLLLEKL